MKTKNKTTAADYIIGIIGMAVLALMLDMAIMGITPSELIADIACWF